MPGCAASPAPTTLPLGLTFGEAIALLKEKKRVARAGWNGRGMFLFLVTPRQHADPEEAECTLDLPGEVAEVWELPQRPVICMKDAQDQVVIGWLASQTDILAEDWTEVS